MSQRQSAESLVHSLVYTLNALSSLDEHYAQLRARNAWRTRYTSKEEYRELLETDAQKLVTKSQKWLREEIAAKLQDLIFKLESNNEYAYATTRRMAPAAEERIHVYKKDPSSPTGVIHAGGFKICEETLKVLAAERKHLSRGPQRGNLGPLHHA